MYHLAHDIGALVTGLFADAIGIHGSVEYVMSYHIILFYITISCVVYDVNTYIHIYIYIYIYIYVYVYVHLHISCMVPGASC